MGDVSCVWEVSWRRGQTATYWPQVLLTIAALLSHSSWAAQSWVTGDPSPLSGAGSHSAGILSPTGTRTDPSRLWHLVIWLSDIHLLPVGVRICHHHRIQPRPQVKVIFRYLRPDAPVSLFFRLFTQVHLLIDGSVEGQYVTGGLLGKLDFLFYFCYWLFISWSPRVCIKKKNGHIHVFVDFSTDLNESLNTWMSATQYWRYFCKSKVFSKLDLSDACLQVMIDEEILKLLTIKHHHHHLVVPPARISLTLSRHSFLSFIASGRSSGLHPVSSQSCCI